MSSPTLGHVLFALASASFSSSRSFWCATSSASWSSSGNIPSRHPTDIPIIAPSTFANRGPRADSCAAVSTGDLKPARSAYASILLLVATPTMSDSKLPSPAAAMVDNASVAPMLRSMYSPAAIMIMLSMNPKPTKGIACARNTA